MKKHHQVWNNYKKFSHHRGQLVAKLLQSFCSVANKKVLDLGCGDGGTSFVFEKSGSQVIAVDIRPDLAEIFSGTNIHYINAQFEDQYFIDYYYDIIIIQDVLEHVPCPEKTLCQVKTSLKKDGVIYVSTPNRYSIFNILSDPHWNLPVVALFSRKIVAFLVREVFRRDRRNREDWAALLSFWKLKRILEDNFFDIKFMNREAVQNMFEKPEAIVCHPFHIKCVNWMKRNGLNHFIIRIVNNQFGFFNYFLNPTWYIIGKLNAGN